MKPEQVAEVALHDRRSECEIWLRKVWDRYAARLRAVARRELARSRVCAVDADDIVQEALVTYWRGVTAGAFSLPDEAEDVWPLLRTITCRRASDYRQREQRQKRGGGRVREVSALDSKAGSSPSQEVRQALDDRPPPDHAVELKELWAQRLSCLDDSTSQKIVLWMMGGYSQEEIAQLLSCARSTVVRRLESIRRIWLAKAAR
jgi:RNA polymerase sigma factor (sigma-70 family)